MNKTVNLNPFVYLSTLLLLFICSSCGEEEIPVFGEYQEVESGYKNCEQGVLSEQIEVLSDRGICWRANSFSECFTTNLTLSPDFTFFRSSSGIKYFDNGTEEEGLQSESLGTFSYEGDFINLYEETRFGIDTTTLSIGLDESLNSINETLLNCERHSLYTKL